MKAKPITCLHCNASRANLSVETELDYAGKHDFIKCAKCGHRVYRKEEPDVVAEKRRIKENATTELCGGCSVNMVHTNMNKSGLCSVCSNRLRNWKRGSQMTPPPVFNINGQWQPNPDRHTRA